MEEKKKKGFKKESFMRDHMAYVSYYGLFAKLKGADSTLLDKLISAGAVSKSASESAISKMESPRL